VKIRPGSTDAVGKKKLTSGAHVSAGGKREGADDGRRESKKKTYFYKYANGARGLSGLGRPVGFSLRKRRGASGSRLGRRPSGPQGRPGQKQGKRISELKIGFLNLARLWKFVEGDLGGILIWGFFFLNSSRLLKDFRKM
jgi:hypothetical protein